MLLLRPWTDEALLLLRERGKKGEQLRTVAVMCAAAVSVVVVVVGTVVDLLVPSPPDRIEKYAVPIKNKSKSQNN